MNFFELTCLSLILILFPLYVYLFFIVYSSDIGKKDHDLLLDFALVTGFYLSMRYGTILCKNEPIFFFNIVLLLSYIKKREKCAFLLTLCSVIYYSILFQYSLLILLIEYMLYLLFYILNIKGIIKDKVFYFLFLVIQILSIIYFCYFGGQKIMNVESTILRAFIVGSTLTVVTGIAKFLFESGESIIRYHNNVKQLKEDEKVRDSLFKITHEIKNPIAVCKGYLDMFNVENLEHSRKYIPIIRKEIASTLLLLEDFLSMNKIKIEKEIMDINLLLEEMSNHFRLLLKEKNIKGKFEFDEDEIYIIGDYNRLMQAFINIVKNSIEALAKTKDGQFSIHTILHENTIDIIMMDNGQGITEEDMKRIKEPFYSTKQRGTGLGVSLSNEIIEGHGGTLIYESEVGKGTKAVITLPIENYE